MNTDDNGTNEARQAAHTRGLLERTPISTAELHINGQYIARGKSTLADAERIVATWNACDGIPTEALDAGVIGDTVKALKWLRACIQETRGADAYDAVDFTDATLAKLEGKP